MRTKAKLKEGRRQVRSLVFYAFFFISSFSFLLYSSVGGLESKYLGKLLTLWLDRCIFFYDLGHSIVNVQDRVLPLI